MKLLLLILLLPLSVLAQINGKVVGISDGDTYTILTAGKKQIKIRLHGIDCPEKAQPFGQQAKNYSSSLVFGKMVKVYEKDIDKYGRTVAIVHLQDGRIVNEELLKNGFAWHYKKYDNNQGWANMENSARASRRGLWADKNVVAPWDFRRSNKK